MLTVSINDRCELFKLFRLCNRLVFILVEEQTQDEEMEADEAEADDQAAEEEATEDGADEQMAGPVVHSASVGPETAGVSLAASTSQVGPPVKRQRRKQKTGCLWLVPFTGRPCKFFLPDDSMMSLMENSVRSLKPMIAWLTLCMHSACKALLRTKVTLQ